ncbi:MAG: purine-nucleoside phosphorylase [Clostridiales bacterium]|nr:purine-nucleoside phosphorylase [Clostridiales bacterium]
MATPHNSAKKGDFAKTVLMPGDPLRAKWIAETFLENAVLVNNVRGVQGYTGYYKGKRVSVMASGMGQPAIGIYSYELFHEYGVECIIRVGTMGGYSEKLHVGDTVIGVGACTNGNFIAQYGLPGTFAPLADFNLARQAAQVLEANKTPYHAGNILSSDVFYAEQENGEQWKKMGVLGVEMEAAALYATAARAGKKALALLAVSDSFVYPEENMSALDRQTTLTTLIETALAVAEG